MIGAPVDDDLTFIDQFCGAGGATQGLSEAGLTPVLAINHAQRAIETHSANFPHVDHWCEDTTLIDMRRLPRARVLWASPICTEASPAGGRKRSRKQAPGQEELELFGPVKPELMVRTRATFYDVLRAVEVRGFEVVLIENVVEVAKDWELFDWWIEAMKLVGPYNVQFVSVSSAHIGDDESNDPAPQWRDRLYLVFTRVGIPLPDVEPRPLAWCPECQQDTHALQSWKRPGRHIGKYRQQYVYVCERAACRHAEVEPYVLPAAAAIDWSDLGTRIGDRPIKDYYKKGEFIGRGPLAPNTLRRIEAGLSMFAQPITVEKSGNTFERPGYFRAWPALDAPLTTLTTDATKGLACPPVMLSTIHDDSPRAYPATAAPLPSRTARIGDGMAALPFVTELRGGSSTARSVADPLATITANGNHHGLTIPPGALVMRNFTPRGNWAQMSKPAATHPLGTITGRDHHSLVIPFRRGGRPHRAAAAPLSTLTTREGHALLSDHGVDLMDCLFRMLQPREHLSAQRFPRSYVVKGNVGEQTLQAGNAVSANVPHWLGRAIRVALGAEAA